MLYLLQTVKSYESVGSTVYHFGYKCEVKENKEVWAEIPDELYETEVACGRILAEVKKVAKPVVETPKPVIEVIVEQPKIVVAEPEVTIEHPAVIEAPVVKIDGRSKASKQSKY